MERPSTPRIFLFTIALLVVLFGGLTAAHADIPQTLTHQGRLIQSGVPVNETRPVSFSLYDDTDAEVHTEVIDVTFDNGYYTVRLGEGAKTLPPELFSQGALKLGIVIDPTGANVELTPKQTITAVPYSFVAESLSGGSVNASTIAVTNSGDSKTVINASGSWVGNPVGGAHIENESIDSLKLRSDAVATNHLQDTSVTGAKIAPQAIDSTHLADNSVSSADLADGSVTGADIAADAITRDNVKPGGGLYSRKSDLYETIVSFSTSPGTTSYGEATCADANDLPLTGHCYTVSNAELRSSRAQGWVDESAAASHECAFFNPTGADTLSEARIICVSVP